MELIEPSILFKTSYIDAVKEFAALPATAAGGNRDAFYRNASIQNLESDFESFVECERSHARGENLRPGYVPYTNYWLVDGDKFIGSLDIRHTLNDNLMQLGGHIGYDVRPSQRRKGYGTTMLKLALTKAGELGLTRVLITCDESNIGSQKIIEANGGVLENRVTDPATGALKLRYWISL